MKIGIHGQYFSVGNTGGTEIYYRNLISALRERNSGHEFYIFVDKKWHSEFKNLPENFHLLGVFAEPNLFERILYKIRVAKYDSQRMLLRQVNRAHLDVVHLCYTEIDPSGIEGRKVVTVYDLQHRRLPEMFSPEELKERESRYKNSLRGSDEIIAISENTARDVQKYYDIESSNISIIPITYDETLFRGAVGSPVEGLPDAYFYYPASRWPHKNHMRLLQAFKKIAEIDPGISLVLSGVAQARDAEISSEIKRLDLNGRVTFLPFLKREQMPTVYAKATALIYPSLFEGFGIPPLEAMAMNCPVACSNTTSLPEVVGDAALYFDPTNVDEITKAMKKLLTDKKIRKGLVEKGKRRLPLFSKDVMGQKTLECYEKAIL